MSFNKSILVIPLLLLAISAGCTKPDAADSEANTEASQVALSSVNTHCPMMGEEIDPEVTAQWQGKTVAFCCAECIPDWNALSDEEKQMKLHAADGEDHTGHEHGDHGSHSK